MNIGVNNYKTTIVYAFTFYEEHFQSAKSVKQNIYINRDKGVARFFFSRGKVIDNENILHIV